MNDDRRDSVQVPAEEAERDIANIKKAAERPADSGDDVGPSDQR